LFVEFLPVGQDGGCVREDRKKERYEKIPNVLDKLRRLGIFCFMDIPKSLVLKTLKKSPVLASFWKTPVSEFSSP
jgi:hypothetical protein